MRAKSSSPKSKNVGNLEIEKLDKLKEPHLSGAYIRNLVKQLTSSRTKDSSNTLTSDSSNNQDLVGNTSEKSPSPPPPQQHKKQVRRRLHTSRPYQERLLNMAEARREIVTALKFHRASMKQASESKQESVKLESLEQKSRRNPRIYASNSTTPNLSTHNNFDSSLSYSPGYSSPYPWPVSPIFPPPFFQENLNFQLPTQTLGLNLNLQDFTYLDTSNIYTSSNPSSIYSSSSTSSVLSAATEEIPFTVVSPPEIVVGEVDFGDSGLHPVMDDKEIAEIRSIGDQHQLEWNDTMNLMTSACWFKFLKDMDIGSEDHENGDFVNSPFDEVLEFPVWLGENDQNLLQHMNDYCCDDDLQDSDLPCMEIEEMDMDWFA